MCTDLDSIHWIQPHHIHWEFDKLYQNLFRKQKEPIRNMPTVNNTYANKFNNNFSETFFGSCRRWKKLYNNCTELNTMRTDILWTFNNYFHIRFASTIFRRNKFDVINLCSRCWFLSSLKACWPCQSRHLLSFGSWNGRARCKHIFASSNFSLFTLAGVMFSETFPTPAMTLCKNVEYECFLRIEIIYEYIE